jgi:hypothetical protein
MVLARQAVCNPADAGPSGAVIAGFHPVVFGPGRGTPDPLGYNPAQLSFD